MKENDFKGKTIWITGSSDGIGRELAIQLSRLGARIILTARRVEALEKVKRDLSGEDHIIFPMDLMNVKLIPDKTEELLAEVKNIDMLINCAGITQRSLISETDIEVDRKVMELDYFSIVALTKSLLPYFKSKKAGSFVSISSVSGKLGTPMRGSYCAAKHALMGYMDALRAEVHKDNIKVLVVTPGSIKTDICKSALTGDGSTYGKTDPAIENGIPVEDCARKIIKGIKKDKSELLIANLKEGGAVYIKRFFPGLLFRLVRNVQTT